MIVKNLVAAFNAILTGANVQFKILRVSPEDLKYPFAIISSFTEALENLKGGSLAGTFRGGLHFKYF